MRIRNEPLFTFHVFVEPAEKFAVPDQRVLRFEDLVRFVLELDQPRRYPLYPGCREGFKRLRVGDAEVFFACDDQDRGVPVRYELVGRVGIGTLRHGVLFVPVGTP